MKLALAAVLVAGCGRLSFDDRADGGTGDGPRDTGSATDAAPHGSLTHDEDGDGIVDGLDGCPHLSGDPADTDGDGVDDACDPEPTNPRQRITLFDGFEAGVPANLTAATGWVQRTDAIAWPGASFGFVEWNPHAVTDVDIAAGWTIVSIPATVTHQILTGMDQPGGTQTYGEVYGDTTAAFASVTNFDGTNYNNYDMSTFAGFTTGRVDTVFHAFAGPPTVTFEATWSGMPTYRSTTTMAPYGPAPNLGVTIRDLDAELRYLLVIESN